MTKDDAILNCVEQIGQDYIDDLKYMWIEAVKACAEAICRVECLESSNGPGDVCKNKEICAHHEAIMKIGEE
jgi:hypothetical protein